MDDHLTKEDDELPLLKDMIELIEGSGGEDTIEM